MQFLFADHMLDTDRRELRRGFEPVAVEPQVFDLLVYLVQNRDRVVSKDDLIASVWGGRIVSEFDADQPHQRRAKGGRRQRRGQKLIRTIARKGLRFVGAVRTRPNGAEPAPATGPVAGRSPEPSRRPCRCPTGRPSPCFPSPT